MKNAGDILKELYEVKEVMDKKHGTEAWEKARNRYWTLRWVLDALEEPKPCEYCKSKSDAKDLLKTKHDLIFIDPDEKKIVWEHTDFFNDMEDPFDPDEVTITAEVEVEFCPKCGAKLGN
jgi:hypothetical protein